MNGDDDDFLIPCPDCRREGPIHLVPCAVDAQVLEDEGVDDPADIPLGRLYDLHDRGLGVTTDRVCGDCGSDYVRDLDGNIIE